MISVRLEPPWLECDLGADQSVLSWSLNRPGFVTANRILWREVRNADLPVDLDVDAWLEDQLTYRSAQDAVVLLTSRDIRAFTHRSRSVENVTAHAVATVGFSNAERVGSRVDRSMQDWGTINVAVHISEGLNQAAQLEALSIAVQARSAAVMDADIALPTGRATGTGTDCIAVACPAGKERFAGLHTAIGETVGGAVYDAVFDGARDWLETSGGKDHAP